MISSGDAQQSSESGGILSGLAQHFPFLFSFWGRHEPQQVDTWKGNATESLSPSEVIEFYDLNERADRIAPDVIDDSFSQHFRSLEPPVNSKSIKSNASRFILSLICLVTFFFFFCFHKLTLVFVNE